MSMLRAHLCVMCVFVCGCVVHVLDKINCGNHEEKVICRELFLFNRGQCYLSD